MALQSRRRSRVCANRFSGKVFFAGLFLSQQVVEKSLKAFLLAKGRTYPRLHKVIELSKLCVELAADLEPLRNNLKLIDEFYIPTRYPDAIPGGLAEGLPGTEEAKLALDTATAVLELVRDRV